MYRILFVDDEDNVLQGLKVMLHPMRGSWDMSFACGGAEARDLIAQSEPFDVVVSDMHMQDIHGADLLALVKETSPFSIRIALAGSFDSETLARCSEVAHQILSKPCESGTLRGLIARAFLLRERLDNPKLRKTLHQIGMLPSVPSMFAELLALLQSEESSMREIGELIARDPALSAKILQIANSASAGLRHPVSDIAHAAAMIGIDAIKAYVLFAEMFKSVPESNLPTGYTLSAIWDHALEVARHAKAIAEEEGGDRHVQDDAYTAGLLHDIGLLVVAFQAPEELATAVAAAREKHIPLADAERETFGASHAIVGSYLLDLWGISENVVTAIGYHDYPSGLPSAGYDPDVNEAVLPLLAVHIANFFAEEDTADQQGGTALPVDTVFLELSGMAGHLEAWYDVCH